MQKMLIYQIKGKGWFPTMNQPKGYLVVSIEKRRIFNSVNYISIMICQNSLVVKCIAYRIGFKLN